MIPMTIAAGTMCPGNGAKASGSTGDMRCANRIHRATVCFFGISTQQAISTQRVQDPDGFAQDRESMYNQPEVPL